MKKTESSSWRLFCFTAALGFAAGYILSSFNRSHESILTSKLLDWPFLTFVMLACFVVLFFDSLVAVISRGEFTIAWGKDQNIKIRNLSAAVSGELSPIQEDVEALKIAVASPQEQTSTGFRTPGVDEQTLESDSANAPTPNSPEVNIIEARVRRLRDALGNPKYKWRSIERLSSIVAERQISR